MTVLIVRDVSGAISDSVDAKATIDLLLGDKANAEIVDHIISRIETIVMPWRRNGRSPPVERQDVRAGDQAGRA